MRRPAPPAAQCPGLSQANGRSPRAEGPGRRLVVASFVSSCRCRNRPVCGSETRDGSEEAGGGIRTVLTCCLQGTAGIPTCEAPPRHESTALDDTVSLRARRHAELRVDRSNDQPSERHRLTCRVVMLLGLSARGSAGTRNALQDPRRLSVTKRLHTARHPRRARHERRWISTLAIARTRPA